MVGGPLIHTHTPKAVNVICYATVAFLWREGTTPILEKKGFENAGANEDLCGFPSIWESLREMLRELWLSYCSSREMPFCERTKVRILRIRFMHSESCSENTPEINGLFTPRAFFVMHLLCLETIISCKRSHIGYGI